MASSERTEVGSFELRLFANSVPVYLRNLSKWGTYFVCHAYGDHRILCVPGLEVADLDSALSKSFFWLWQSLPSVWSALSKWCMIPDSPLIFRIQANTPCCTRSRI